MAEENNPALENLNEAIQDLFNTLPDVPSGAMVDAALVVVELVRMDEDGEMMRKVTYTIPTLNAALTAAYGLAYAGAAMIKRDVFDKDDNG